MARVILFNTVAAPHLAARLHDSECPMVKNMASRPGRRTPVRWSVVDAADIADLNERGFPVKECKCLKKRPT